MKSSPQWLINWRPYQCTISVTESNNVFQTVHAFENSIVGSLIHSYVSRHLSVGSAGQTFDWGYSGSVERILRVINYEIPIRLATFNKFFDQAMDNLTEQVSSLHDPRAGFPKKKLRRIT